MTAEILTLVVPDVGEGFTIEPDRCLEDAKGKLTKVVVLGIEEDGSFSLWGSRGKHETLWLLRQGEHYLFGMGE